MDFWSQLPRRLLSSRLGHACIRGSSRWDSNGCCVGGVEKGLWHFAGSPRGVLFRRSAFIWSSSRTRRIDRSFASSRSTRWSLGPSDRWRSGCRPRLDSSSSSFRCFAGNCRISQALQPGDRSSRSDSAFYGASLRPFSNARCSTCSSHGMGNKSFSRGTSKLLLCGRRGRGGARGDCSVPWPGSKRPKGKGHSSWWSATSWYWWRRKARCKLEDEEAYGCNFGLFSGCIGDSTSSNLESAGRAYTSASRGGAEVSAGHPDISFGSAFGRNFYSWIVGCLTEVSSDAFRDASSPGCCVDGSSSEVGGCGNLFSFSQTGGGQAAGGGSGAWKLRSGSCCVGSESGSYSTGWTDSSECRPVVRHQLILNELLFPRCNGKDEVATGAVNAERHIFVSVCQNMARRMSPSQICEQQPMELYQRGVSATKYLERFGGFGKVKDLGQIAWQVGIIMDHLQCDNLAAAKDATSLLLVCLEQGALDAGHLEIGLLLALSEDPPAGLFSNRSLAPLSRGKSFAPLAEQKWISLALSYIKELDVITQKRADLAGVPVKSTAAPAAPVPTPKPKPKQKKAAWKKNQKSQEDAEGEEWTLDLKLHMFPSCRF